MKELQTRRFKEQIEEILGTDCTMTHNIDDTGTLHKAKIHTTQVLDAEKLNGLMSVADAWCCDLEMYRSSNGITTNLKMNTALMAAIQN